MHKIAVFCDSTPHALHGSEGNWRSQKMKPLAGCLLGVNIQEMLILLMMSFHSLDVESIYWVSTSIYSGYVESIYWVSTSVFSGLYLLWALAVISLHETFLVRLPGLLRSSMLSLKSFSWITLSKPMIRAISEPKSWLWVWWHRPVMPALRIQRQMGVCFTCVGATKSQYPKRTNQTKSRLIVRLLSISTVPNSETAACSKCREGCRQEIVSHA